MSKARMIVLSVFIYSLFAGLVFIIHGGEPTLNIDHIYYFNLVDQIRLQHPDGSYWKSFSALNSYAILIAYIYDFTGGIIYAFKWSLAFITIAYLLAFELLMSLFTSSKLQRVLFSLLSALFVSFGAPFWGFTDFSASLNRSIVVPFMVLGIWFFLKFFDSGWRYLVYPYLVAVSTLHLSSYYLMGVLLIFEGWDFIFLRKRKVDRRVFYWLTGLLTAYGMRRILDNALVVTNYFTSKIAEGIAYGQGATLKGYLDYKDAWDIELYAFPWRNMPLPFTTVATILSSYGIILFLAMCGMWKTYRNGWNRFDKIMTGFFISVVFGAYGIQTIFWILRNISQVYPMNFEEVRAINLIMIPSIYFVFRLTEILISKSGKPVNTRIIAGGMALLVVLQPIILLHLAPNSFRTMLVEESVKRGLIKQEDTFRLNYARQFLGIDNEANRFYYSTRGVAGWLGSNVRPGSRILTDRSDIAGIGINFIGNFTGVMDHGISSVEQIDWQRSVSDIHSAIQSGNSAEVMKVAKHYGAQYAIVPWVVEDAVYADEFYSVIEIDNGGKR